MVSHRAYVQLDENNHEFLKNIRREIMIENGVNIPYNYVIELGLIELRKNNKKQEIKEKLIHHKRIGKIAVKGIINSIKDD